MHSLIKRGNLQSVYFNIYTESILTIFELKKFSYPLKRIIVSLKCFIALALSCKISSRNFPSSLISLTWMVMSYSDMSASSG